MENESIDLCHFYSKVLYLVSAAILLQLPHFWCPLNGEQTRLFRE